MKYFVTGASGFIGSAVVPELLKHGHRVVGLARSEASAAAVSSLGAEVLRGDLEDLEVLSTGARASDGVIHLGFVHDFARFEEVCHIDHRAIMAMGEALAGSDKPLVIASGVLGLPSDRTVTEDDVPQLKATEFPRLLGVEATLSFATRGVRSSVVRLAPTVHGEGDRGFIPHMINVARERGVSAYVGDGTKHWPAVHRLDAAALFRLAAERAPAGSTLHGVDDAGVEMREIASVIGRHLNVPVASIAPEEADAHFGWLGRFLHLDVVASNAITREATGWLPVHPRLLADLEAGHYFANQTAAYS